jgi:hypothetical protein
MQIYPDVYALRAVGFGYHSPLRPASNPCRLGAKWNLAAPGAQYQGTFDAKKPVGQGWPNSYSGLINMRNSPLSTILLGVLTLSVLASVVLCWLGISNTRELRALQTQAALINNNRALINALVTDPME